MINWCNANQGFVMVVLTFVYVAATIYIVQLGKHANKIAQANLKTLEELEREKSRPVIDLAIVADNPLVSLQVSNHGLTPAYDIRISIMPSLKYFQDDGKDIPLGILKHGIGSLAPGSNTTTLIGSFSQLKERNSNLQYDGTATFRDVNNTSYETPIHIDLRWMENNRYIHRKTLHDVAEQIEKLQKEFHHFATGLHKPFIIMQDAKDKEAADQERHETFLAMQKDKTNHVEEA